LVTAAEVETTALTLEEATAEDTTLALDAAAADETTLALEEATAEALTALDEVTTALADEEGATEEAVDLGAVEVVVVAVLHQPNPKKQKVRLSRE
jgi:hypothetical protein